MRPLSRTLLGALSLILASAVPVTAIPPAAAEPVQEPAPVAAAVETPALFDDDAGGNADADDPAIWLHPRRPDASVVVATAKEGGLEVYRLDGRRLQHIAAPAAPGPEDAPGRFNNVDLVYGFDVGGRRVDLAVVSDRGRDRVRFYAIDPARAAAGQAPLSDLTDAAAPFVFSADQAEVNDQRTAYGLAAWQDGGAAYALVSRRNTTRMALLRLTAAAGGRVGYRPVRTLDLPASFRLPDGSAWTPCLEPGEQPQVEGMVVDLDRDVLYAAQEDVGVWRLPAALTGSPVLVDRVREYGVPGVFDPETEECTPGADPGFGGRHLSADAEGLTLYYRGDGKGYLLASSQGDDTFAVYRREGGNAYLGSFSLTGDEGVDSVQESDGAAVLNAPLGERFEEGLLAVHDGQNTPAVPDGTGADRANSNFKFVEWDDVADGLDLAVDTDGWNPRGIAAQQEGARQ
jgi:3-phytase